MYEYIKGKLIQIEPLKAIVEVNNIAYRLNIPISSYNGQIGAEILFHTSFIVREDAHTLYGFLTKKERDLFEMIITVSGIGPKTALALVGHIDIRHFESAVAAGDIRLISKVPGIGKKTAERLIIEMRDKLKIFSKTESGFASSPSGQTESDRTLLDAISALINLGYNPLQAQKAVKKAADINKDEKDAGKLITLALKNL